MEIPVHNKVAAEQGWGTDPPDAVSAANVGFQREGSPTVRALESCSQRGIDLGGYLGLASEITAQHDKALDSLLWSAAYMGLPHILVSIGTRPEAIKMALLVRELQRASWCRVSVVVTGQHREMLDQVLLFFEIQPDTDLDLMQESQPLVDLTDRLLGRLDDHLAKVRPDLVLVQGDTTTVFATALACFYRKIPVAHLEAGLRSGVRSSPFPEEMNRQMVTRLADLHFAPTEQAAANLEAEGVAKDTVFVLGNTGIDALLWSESRVNLGRFLPAGDKRLILVTAHRRENLGAGLLEICQALRILAESRDVEILYPLHKNPQVENSVREWLGAQSGIRLVEPLPYADFVAAMSASFLILTDSGGVQEEAPALGKPVLVMRGDTERPEGLAMGVAQLIGVRAAVIVEAVERLLDDPQAYSAMARRSYPYGDGRSVPQIAEVLRVWLAGC